MNEFQMKMAREVCFAVMDSYDFSYRWEADVKKGERLESTVLWKAMVALGHTAKLDEMRKRAVELKLAA